MKKALLCGLSAALLLALVLVACNKPQADQPAGPDPTQTVTSTPEPEQTPEPVTTPEPEQTPAAPAQLSGTTQADPDEADPSQPPEETAPQSPAADPAPAQTTTPAPENTPKPATNPAPQESQPTIVEPEPAPEPEEGGPGIVDCGISSGTQTQPSSSQGMDRMLEWAAEETEYIDTVENYLKNHPNAYLDEYGEIVDPDVAVNMN